MTNYGTTEGEVLDLVAPNGGCESGQFITNGSLHGVAKNKAAAGDVVACVPEGSFFLPKKTGEAHTKGDAVDFVTGKFQKTLVGPARAICYADAASDAATAEYLIIPPAKAPGGSDGIPPVDPAVDGNFPELDADGNLVDSGHKHADYATASQGAKADTALQPADIAFSVETLAINGTTHKATLTGGKVFGGGCACDSVDGSSFFLVVPFGAPVKSGSGAATCKYDPADNSFLFASDETVTSIKVLARAK